MSACFGNLSNLQAVFQDAEHGISLYQGDSLSILRQISEAYPGGVFDMIFADPPYFLSNDGVTCQSGRMASVNKGRWDRSMGVLQNHEFNLAWLRLCQQLLKPDGTIWITGTHHVIFSVGFALQALGYKILNDITWEKPNPPPNLSCRYFTHASETVIWAARDERARHYFNYDLMKALAGHKQMKSVWRLYPPTPAEKMLGKHPTQKPIALVRRCILASTKPGDLVLDPFMGSGTTAVACLTEQRHFVGIENERAWIDLAIRRLTYQRKEAACLVAV